MNSSRRWCSSCMMKKIVYTTDLGYTCCNNCGKVLADPLVREEPQFGKNGDWLNLVHVSSVKAVASEYSASRERTLNRGLENLTLTEDLHSNASGQRNGDGGARTSPGLSCLNPSKTGSGQLITCHVSNTSDPPEGLRGLRTTKGSTRIQNPPSIME